MKIQPYKTLNSPNESELKEKRSIFLAKAYPVGNQDDIKNLMNDLKKRYYDASHRCNAYRLRSGNSKFSDAGEPSGTAGIRILNAIDHYELQDCLVAVIRYFGGTKMGVSLLGKTYYSAATKVLSESDIITKKPYAYAELKLTISSLDKLTPILVYNQIKVKETTYGAEVRLKCLIPFELVKNIKDRILEMFKGEVVFLTKDEIFFE